MTNRRLIITDLSRENIARLLVTVLVASLAAVHSLIITDLSRESAARIVVTALVVPFADIHTLSAQPIAGSFSDVTRLAVSTL